MRAYLGNLVLGCLLAASAVPGLAQAQPEVIAFNVDGQRVTGTLTLPKGIRKPPVVLMLHGFTGNRNEWTTSHVPEGLFGRTAPALAEKGIASLRIDFRGSGDSEGKFEDVTVESEVADALGALAWLEKQPRVDGKRISVLGMSLGGVVAAGVAGRTNDRLKSLILWNPGINPPLAFTKIFGESNMSLGASAGDSVFMARTLQGKEILLRGKFFESLYKYVPAAELTSYHGPLLLAVGTNDEIVSPQPLLAQSLLAYHHGLEELWARPVGHDFGIGSEDSTLGELIKKTVAFLKTHAF